MVPILPDFHQREVENILEHAEVSRIFISRKHLPKLKDVENKYKIMILEEIFQNENFTSLDDELFLPIYSKWLFAIN